MIWFLSGLAWLAGSLVLMALIEYLIHRYPMHNGRFVRKTGIGTDVLEAHSVLHHGRYYKGEAFENNPDPAAPRISMKIEKEFNLVGLAPIWLTLCLFVSVLGGVIFAMVTVAQATVWTMVHREMHVPTGRWFSRTRYYRYLRAWHYTHHVHPGTNFAAVFPPFFDWLFGTYRKPLV